jgi:hypothetical protein
VLGPQEQIIGQRDALDAPSWDWQPGDIILQIHPIVIPPETPAGSYTTIVGIYDRASGDRLPVLNASGEIVDNRAFVVTLDIDG